MNEGIHAGSLNFGVGHQGRPRRKEKKRKKKKKEKRHGYSKVIVYDLETVHDSERGNYAEKGQGK